MNDFDKPRKNPLEISHEELGILMTTLADKLVRKGNPHPIEDAFLREDDPTPFSFGYDIPILTAKQIFYPEDSEIEVLESRVHYNQPHRIDVPPNDQLIQGVYVILNSRIIGSDIMVRQITTLSQDSKLHAYVTGSVAVEYGDQDGFSLSSPVVERSNRTPEEVYEQVINQYAEGDRPLMIRDVEQLRQLIDDIDQVG